MPLAALGAEKWHEQLASMIACTLAKVGSAGSPVVSVPPVSVSVSPPVEAGPPPSNSAPPIHDRITWLFGFRKSLSAGMRGTVRVRPRLDSSASGSITIARYEFAVSPSVTSGTPLISPVRMPSSSSPASTGRVAPGE
ncbi:hypothetical protein OV079_40675 [Nannocystis pusilla]|uniref:Uncharacterized protein n=1 Tax=Nannocystis pusilla TaxID=889268 RepID=A0A9X3EWR0_9BACT|nr:hypothetical protein [Nannocystis pusilla]MCY1011764.1 hypothetical protein [Nannocystis pusilla]